MRLGRIKSTAKKLHLAAYKTAVCLPTPPATCDYSLKADAALSQVYLNDTLGDCVIAGGYHVLGTVTGNATGTPFIATASQILADYKAIGGYDGTPATDNGCDEVQALNYWTNPGFQSGSKLAAWAVVDASNPDSVKEAVYLFETCFLGLDLPDAWITPFPSATGFVWDVQGPPNANNGHCVMVVGYTALGVVICSWGLLGTITWSALAKYGIAPAGGECYALLMPASINPTTSKSPLGFDYATLLQDFGVLNG